MSGSVYQVGPDGINDMRLLIAVRDALTSIGYDVNSNLHRMMLQKYARRLAIVDGVLMIDSQTFLSYFQANPSLITPNVGTFGGFPPPDYSKSGS